MTFKRGDKVIVTGVTLYGSFEGCEGVIIRNSQFYDWLVDVTFPDGNHDELGFDAHELTPAQPPAPDTVRDVTAGEGASVELDMFDKVVAVLQHEFASDNYTGDFTMIMQMFQGIEKWRREQVAAIDAARAELVRVVGERDAARKALDNVIVNLACVDEVPDSVYNFARREQQVAANPSAASEGGG